MLETQNQSRREAELYQDVYKNVTMGAESLTDLMRHVNEGDLKTEMGVELAQYETLAKAARQALTDLGVTPREQGAVTKLSAKAGVMMNTMVDSTPSHVAQMVIEGTTMGTTDLLRKINEFSCEAGEGSEAQKLARRAVRFEEDCIEKMKTYL
ncbi:MAG: hypothetical protein IKV00_00695 [Clostridia bacterium]|nr:hypothetical protein [Clostridia bacterium]